MILKGHLECVAKKIVNRKCTGPLIITCTPGTCTPGTCTPGTCTPGTCTFRQQQFSLTYCWHTRVYQCDTWFGVSLHVGGMDSARDCEGEYSVRTAI